MGSMKSAFSTLLNLCYLTLPTNGSSNLRYTYVIRYSLRYSLSYSYHSTNVVLTYPYPYHNPNVGSLDYVNVGKKTKKKTL